MSLIMRLATENDIDAMERLYDNVNDFLSGSINYPGWQKGVYPTRTDAAQGVKEGSLFVATLSDKIVGSFILRHKPESAYQNAKWRIESDYAYILVIYTFAVHPGYLRMGVGEGLLQFAEEYARKQEIRSLRLDVYEKNVPAIKLYEKCGFQYIDSVDLGLGAYGLNWFKLYEKLL